MASSALRLLALLAVLEMVSVALAWALDALQGWVTEMWCWVEESLARKGIHV